MEENKNNQRNQITDARTTNGGRNQQTDDKPQNDENKNLYDPEGNTNKVVDDTAGNENETENSENLTTTNTHKDTNINF